MLRLRLYSKEGGIFLGGHGVDPCPLSPTLHDGRQTPPRDSKKCLALIETNNMQARDRQLTKIVTSVCHHPPIFSPDSHSSHVPQAYGDLLRNRCSFFDNCYPFGTPPSRHMLPLIFMRNLAKLRPKLPHWYHMISQRPFTIEVRNKKKPR